MKLIESILLQAKSAYNRLQISRRFPNDGVLRNDGVGLIAEIDYAFSVSQLARDFINTISETRIPFSLINASLPVHLGKCICPEEQSHFRSLISKKFNQRHVINFSTIPSAHVPNYCNAITPFWEFKSGMLECRPNLFDGQDVVIAYSNFNKEYFESLVPSGVKVLKFTYPLRKQSLSKIDRKTARKKFALPEDSFLAFFNFDFKSCYERKNPEAAVEAFAKAFPNKKDTGLVFKTAHPGDDMAKRKALADYAARLNVADRVFFFDDFLPRKSLLELASSCDTYISLHRGEGLGMGMIESMTLGIPVIATDFGGNTDFINQTTGIPIPYKLVQAKTSFPAYIHVREWADPEIDAAAAALRRLYENPAERNRLGTEAKKYIDSFYSQENFIKGIRQFLEI